MMLRSAEIIIRLVVIDHDSLYTPESPQAAVAARIAYTDVHLISPEVVTFYRAKGERG